MADRSHDAGAAPSEGAAPALVPVAPPAATPEARAFFGERLSLAEGFVSALASTGVTHGLIGPREVPRLWERHVLNCAVIESLVPPGATVVDVGSGAGLPGAALAIARPDLRVHLVEPMQRRTDWLLTVVDELGLEGVSVHHARAQDVAGVVTASTATARAVTSIGRLAGWCTPLLEAGGQVLAIKGARVHEELVSDARGLQRAGVVDSEVLSCGMGVVDPPTTVARLVVGARHQPGAGRAADDLRRGRAGKGRRR